MSETKVVPCPFGRKNSWHIQVDGVDYRAPDNQICWFVEAEALAKAAELRKESDGTQEQVVKASRHPAHESLQAEKGVATASAETAGEACTSRNYNQNSNESVVAKLQEQFQCFDKGCSGCQHDARLIASAIAAARTVETRPPAPTRCQYWRFDGEKQCPMLAKPGTQLCDAHTSIASEPVEQAAPPHPLLSAKYTMTFALSPDFSSMLLLKKPDNHKNPLFRGNWSVPGGKIEDGEDAAVGASRELQEESGLSVPPERLRLVTRIYCNCDPTETEHEVIVYGAIVSAKELSAAKGLSEEPVQVFDSLPNNCVWHIQPLFDLVIGRMKQPAPAAIEQARPQTPKYSRASELDADEWDANHAAAAEPAPERTLPHEHPEICPVCDSPYCEHDEAEQNLIKKAWEAGFAARAVAVPEPAAQPNHQKRDGREWRTGAPGRAGYIDEDGDNLLHSERRKPFARELNAEPAAQQESGIIVKTTTGITLSTERYNALIDKEADLLNWRFRTLAALQCLRSFTGINDLNILSAKLDDGTYWDLLPGISVTVSKEEKDWMIPLAHADGRTLGAWINKLFHDAAQRYRDALKTHVNCTKHCGCPVPTSATSVQNAVPESWITLAAFEIKEAIGDSGEKPKPHTTHDLVEIIERRFRARQAEPAPGLMPSCTLCGKIMQGVCECGNKTGVGEPAPTPSRQEIAQEVFDLATRIGKNWHIGGFIGEVKRAWNRKTGCTNE